MENNKIYTGTDIDSSNLKKYKNKNLIHQAVLNRFFDAISNELKGITEGNVLEFGCGEGLFLNELRKRGVCFKDLLGIDLREDALIYARQLNPMYRFERVDILNSGFDDKSFDLVIASEVLEHLEDSALYLKKLVELSRQYIFLTVPWEPWFQLMNFLRGRDFFRLGNHPEHVNHWGLKRFRKYVAQFAQVEKAFTVFPFIIVMALTGEV